MTDTPRRLPPLNALRAFDAAARTLTFRQAAEELGVSQGAVAQQVRALEAQLGVRLFDRLPRTLALTEAGRRYAATLRRAFDLIAAATAELKPEPQHLTISVTPSFASRWLIPRLPAFTALHPDIDLRILASDRVSTFQGDQVDLAVRYGHPPFAAGLQADLLFDQALVAVASPLLLARLGPPDTAADLARYPLLHDAHNVWPQMLDQVFPAGTPPAPHNIRFNQTALAIEAAVAGQGLALASHFFVSDDLRDGRLSRVFPGAEVRTGSDFYVISPRRPRHPAPVAAVRHWLLAAAGRA